MSDILVPEPIAIIGMAGRFACAPDIEALWTLMCDGRDAITEVPRQRFDVDAVYDPTPRTPGRTVSRWGGFLDRIDEFDAEFFGISPREAEKMDPQQRLLLETTHDAFEDAGQPADRLAGSNAGTFLGQLGADYWDVQCRDSNGLDFYAMTGSAARAMTSGRLAYAFDLRGPSLTVDTACSSSLVAVHLAVQSLRAGECAIAIAGGVNLVLVPDAGIVYSGAGMLAKDGRCKFADATADGFVRSDGVGVVILKPLARARADGDRVRAVILGSAVGNDGQSSGFLVTPGVEGQRQVMVTAYRSAGVNPADVDFAEAHGTGTSVGDPVELEAFGSVLGVGRPADRPCFIGSVKTNIGHAEAAAGIAGLIKAVLCLEHRMVPPSLHVKNPNPAVPWQKLLLQIPQELIYLPDRGRPPLAAVSSFGFTGTNTHLVITGDRTADAQPRTDDPRAQLLTMSAATPEALTALAAKYVDFLDMGSSARSWPLRDICYSATLRRSHQESRMALVATSHDQAAAALREFVAAGSAPQLSVADYVDKARPRVAFVFPGQGSQWVGMGRELLETDPIFLAAMRECDEVIRAEARWSVIELLRAGGPQQFAELDVIQPALWAMEVALAAVWRSWGIEPDVVIGHSMGESAAAYVAGVLSLADAGAVICRRSKLAKRLSGRGTMVWVELPAGAAVEAATGFESQVSLAAANSPTSTLLSGEPDALAAILAKLDRREVFHRWVNVDFASHGPQVDSIRADLLAALADLHPRAGTIPIRSTLLNEVIDGATMNATYWARNIREPVNFVGAIRGELEVGDTVFVEISPHPLLVSAMKETGQACGSETRAFGSLRREEPERASLLAALGNLYTAGAAINWQAVTDGGRFVPLPRYAWQRASYWVNSRESRAAREPRPPIVKGTHPLLGGEVAAPAGQRRWEGPIDLTRNGYLCDHRIQGVVILPGTAYLELVLAAGREVLGDVPVTVSDVHYHQGLFITDDTPQRLRVALTTEGDTMNCMVHSHSGPEDPWTLHAEASVRAISDPPIELMEPIADIRQRCTEHQTGADFYPWHAARGNQWEGAFRAIAEIWRRDGEALARIRCPQTLLASFDQYHFPPALLDASGQCLVAARPDVPQGQDNVFVLGSIGQAHIYRRPERELWSHARLTPTERADSFGGDIRIIDGDGHLVADIRGLRLQYLRGAAPTLATQETDVTVTAGNTDDWRYDLRWVPTEHHATDLPGAASGEHSWLVLTDSGSVGPTVVQSLRERGHRVVVATIAAAFDATGTDQYRVNPARREDLVKVLGELGPCSAVVHLWSLDATPTGDATTKEIEHAELLTCRSVVNLVQAMDEVAIPGKPRLWLVSQQVQSAVSGDVVAAPFQAPLWGLGRSIAAEHPDLRTTLIDLDHDPNSVEALIGELLSPDEEDQIALRGHRRLAARLVRHAIPEVVGSATPALADATVRLRMSASGVLDDVGVVLAPRPIPGPGEVLVRVFHAGLNYRDVLTAIGLYPGQSTDSLEFGWECSGVIEEIGDDVRGLAVGEEVVTCAENGLAAHVVAKASLVVAKPSRLISAEAATIPSAFLTTYYALHELARIQRGERILIHSATGGIGLAAIQIAQSRGARIYATAGSQEKRAVLDLFGVKHVSDSRSLSFVDDFRKATEGAGFDVILNTLAGDAIHANLSLMAPYGRYLELSKRDIIEDTSIGLGVFARNLSFHAIDIVHMIREEPGRAGALLRTVCGLVQRGVLRPLPYREYPATIAAEAFRCMAQAKQIGKLVIAFPDQLLIEAATDAAGRNAVDAVPVQEDGAAGRVSLLPDATYLVTGGLGGIGGQVTRWLADRGARHILLTGRSSLPDPTSWDTLAVDDPRTARVALLRELSQRGVHVEYAVVDVADAPAMSDLLVQHRRAGWPPVRGVLHAAGTIDYSPVRDMDPARISEVLRAKVTGAWVLHRILREEPLDLFVLFSSGSALLGSPFLGAYAAGNAFLDSLAHHRWANGAPATTINWGFWGSVGMVARREREDGRDILPRGMARFTPADGLAILERLVAEHVTQSVVLQVDWQEWARSYPEAAASPLLRTVVNGRNPVVATPLSVPQPSLTHAAAASAVTASVPTSSAQLGRPAPAVVSAAPVATSVPTDRIEKFLVEEVAAVLGLSPDRVNVTRPLSRMGMDSLMAVEFRNRVEREFKVKLPIVKLLSSGNIATIAHAVHESLTS